jgi:CCR4-NOT transcription complex subunit 7/8
VIPDTPSVVIPDARAVARPIPNSAWRTSSDYHYQTMRCNVDLLKLIQIGIAIADEDENFPDETTTW